MTKLTKMTIDKIDRNEITKNDKKKSKMAKNDRIDRMTKKWQKVTEMTKLTEMTEQKWQNITKIDKKWLKKNPFCFLKLASLAILLTWTICLWGKASTLTRPKALWRWGGCWPARWPLGVFGRQNNNKHGSIGWSSEFVAKWKSTLRYIWRIRFECTRENQWSHRRVSPKNLRQFRA